ncbi:hypothetical protein C8J46_102621 [Sphingomonas sp. PP-F2F-A104-K0414]|uniref:hypothetical protein n=1 Tax=Sphingomonas sp. PP-F2F-A104-K0414 TaxID=2135661 RepID=UPI0010DC54F0|nr:hypothetical protein [Sphingomonas sp. PP-F2F-A104-K0414]TCQ00477.1 hypothetical protein C8J46_102621 [Sphingomonas sp. PP-F2F-A104-K0414]
MPAPRPFALLRPIGLVYRFAMEVDDDGLTRDRPCIVDGGEFTLRFGFVPTPFELRVPTIVHAFVKAAGAPGSRT